jgi:hypothetical protein
MSRLKLLMVRVQPVIAVEDDAGQCERVIEEEPRVITAAEWHGYSERLERELAETQAQLLATAQADANGTPPAAAI